MSTELEAWLDRLGLSQYAATFAANAIDFDVLSDLTDADLSKLGIEAMGHRKRLLGAISGLQRARIDNFVVSVDPSPPTPRRRPRAERRQVSVLFCDLVGSTELAHRLDPEELAPITERYHETASQTVQQLGGHIARLVGDGIMAYFGWPVSREDDAERAVAAGLELIEAVSRLPPLAGEVLSVRVAVATGLVAIGYGSKQPDGGISGETPNVAARLQAEAKPNRLVVSPLTARLAGRSFRYKNLGKRTMRGLSEPMEIFEVRGTRSALNRFKALRARSTAPLVGRSEEVELLLSRWRRAADSEGHVALVSGDAGIGKSRLVQSTRDRIGSKAVILSYQCSPLHQDTALFPIVQQLTRSIGLSAEQAVEDKLAKARHWLQSAELETDDNLALLCHLLQIKSPDHRLPGALPQIRERLVALLLNQFMRLTRNGPVLTIVEDVQWVDRTTEDLLIDVIGRIEHVPGMILATSRDPFSLRWHAAGYTTDLRLDRLSGADSRRLIQAIAGERLAPEVQAATAARAEGVPLYLEELTLALLETSRPGELGEIPTSLQALLAARLDKMADAKPLLQVGAVLGRQFSLPDLQMVAGCGEEDLRTMVDKSLESGLLHEAEPGNDSILTFKHALVQDAAYSSLLNSEKRRLHATVLDHLERKDWSATGAGAAVLASHAERGEIWDKAAQYLIGSLGQAIRNSANHEAVGLYDRALTALQRLPADQSAAVAIDAHLHAFSPLLALGEIERLVEAMRQADTLAHTHGDKRRLAAATSQLSSALWLAGEHHAGLQSADEAVRLAEELDDFVLRLSARFNRANLLHATGAIAEAAKGYDAIIDSLVGDLELKRFGWPGIPNILARGLLTWSLVLLGEFERAREITDRALELVGRTREPYSTAYAHMGRGLYLSAIGQSKAAIDSFETAHRIIQQADIVLPIATAWLGSAYAQGGRARQALTLLLEAERKTAYRSGGLYNPIHHYMALAEAHLAVGALANAREAIGHAREIAERAGELAHLAHVFRLLGKIEAADPDSTARAACACYQRAIELARPRGLRPLIAQSLMGLADSCEADGDRASAVRHREEARLLFGELGLAA